MDEQRYPQIDSNKNRLHKKMCRSKDQLNKKNFGTKVKNYKKVPLKLTGNSKANNFHNFFRGNKLNLFKTWEGIREIINISKNRKSHKGVPRKRCSENMQQIYTRTPMPKCDFNKFAK